MANYGFRLFQLELWEKNTRSNKLAFIGDDFNYQEHLLQACNAIEGQTFRGNPASEAPDGNEESPTERKDPVISVVRTLKQGPIILGKIQYGRDADFENAVPNAADDPRGAQDIKDMAPVRTYRYALLPPSDAGSTDALLAVEVISRACPSRQLVRWFKWWSQSLGGEDGNWYRVKAYPVADPELIRQLSNSRVEEMQLQSRRGSTARRQKPVEFKLTSALDTDLKARALERLADAIVAKETEEEFAASLAKLVGVDESSIDFDEGWLIINTPDIGKQKVSVSHVPEVFTYVIGSTLPDDTEFLSAIKSRLSLIPGPVAKGVNRNGW